MSTFLELAVPGYAAALTEQVRVFIRYRGLIGTVGILILLFFSSIAFTVLENAISVIFHRVRAVRRHFLISSIIPYLFILLITLGVLSLSFIVGALEPLESTRLVVFGHKFGLGFIFSLAVYVLGFVAEVFLITAFYLVLPGGAHHLPARAHRGAGRHDPVGNNPPRHRLVLQDLHLREPDLRLLRLGRGVPTRRRGRGAHRPAGSPGHRGARARQRKNTLGIASPDYLDAAAVSLPFLLAVNAQKCRRLGDEALSRDLAVAGEADAVASLLHPVQGEGQLGSPRFLSPGRGARDPARALGSPGPPGRQAFPLHPLLRGRVPPGGSPRRASSR